MQESPRDPLPKLFVYFFCCTCFITFFLCFFLSLHIFIHLYACVLVFNFLFLKPFESRLETSCLFAPKYCRVFSLRTRLSPYIATLQFQNQDILHQMLLSSLYSILIFQQFVKKAIYSYFSLDRNQAYLVVKSLQFP